jgi:hypothetical protein
MYLEAADRSVMPLYGHKRVTTVARRRGKRTLTCRISRRGWGDRGLTVRLSTTMVSTITMEDGRRKTEDGSTTYSSRLRGIKSMRPRAEGDDGSAAMRRGSWEGGRLRILLPLLPLSGATPGRSLNSAGEYRPTTGEPGGRGFRRTGDWTTRGSGWGCTTACDRVKEAKEGMANAARKAGFARGGESSRFPAGACIIKIRCSPLSHGRSQSCSPAQAGGIVVATRPRRVKGGPEAASEQIARPKLVPSKRSRSAVATGGVENGARGGTYAGTNVNQPMGRYQWQRGAGGTGKGLDVATGEAMGC